ncbi:hypothetical protein HPB47_011831 [Ixodes persulcatus]|uniref:Uncharacterized protein n=1 Tax=Ixodes persulcatus TaxID=34615 RepID=A0AC60NVE0_IXOPE|nr:hypothetical protein HPB47_011831 [Ixodes persulcatus]
MQDPGLAGTGTPSYLSQTFCTPSFGDEEFVIPPIDLQNVIEPTPAEEAAIAQAFYESQQGSMLMQPTTLSQPMSASMGGTTTEPTMTFQGNQGPLTDMFQHQMVVAQPSQQAQGVLSYEPVGGQYAGQAQYHQTQPSLLKPNSASPPGSNHASPSQASTSEDSDDSTPLLQLVGGVKRPSPEPLLNNGAAVPGKAAKKARMPKKKGKRDPNEPQKPVSAYALFFRDTQAAIKGQNPNASFGEVSKIVASMWDGLEADHKDVYKRRTEAAKKEYLKMLAEYRASHVSKGGLSPVQKSSPQIASYGEVDSPRRHNVPSPPRAAPSPQRTVAPSPPPVQPPVEHRSPPQAAPIASPSRTVEAVPVPAASTPGAASGDGGPAEAAVAPAGPPRCIRSGCLNPAVESIDWDNEYCSSECVVTHCGDVFTAWVAQQQAASNFVNSGISKMSVR